MTQKITKEIEMYVCPNKSCGYSWIPRVANPKKCPRCQFRLDRKRKEKKEVKK